jgi:tetratricopeptide (TPR) repeat protein
LLATYACELDNLRRALDWSIRHDAPLAVELVALAGWFHSLVGLRHEYRRLAEVLEPAVAAVPADVAALYWVQRSNNSIPSLSTALQCARKAIALYRSIGNQPYSLYIALLWIGWCGPVNEWEAAQAELDEIERSGCPTFLLAFRRYADSSVHYKAGRFAEALEAAEAGLALARPLRWCRAAGLLENSAVSAQLALGRIDPAVRRLQALIGQERNVLGGQLEYSYGNLVAGLILQGGLEEAREALVEFFRQCRVTEGERFPFFAPWCARFALNEQRYETAARLAGFADAERRRNCIGGRELDAICAALATRLDPTTLERLVNEGATMDLEAAFALTLRRADAESELPDRRLAGQ